MSGWKQKAMKCVELCPQCENIKMVMALINSRRDHELERKKKVQHLYVW